MTIDSTARPIHSAGCTYSASQKKRLSVLLPDAPRPSALSKTHVLSPVPVFTSFHHRRPTSRRPAMFFR